MALTDFGFDARISRKSKNTCFICIFVCVSFYSKKVGFCRESVVDQDETKSQLCCLRRADRTGAIRSQIWRTDLRRSRVDRGEVGSGKTVFSRKSRHFMYRFARDRTWRAIRVFYTHCEGLSYKYWGLVDLFAKLHLGIYSFLGFGAT